MKKAILMALLITMVVGCKKDENKKGSVTHTIQVTGHSFNVQLTISGTVYYSPLATYSANSGETVKVRDTGSTNNSYKNVTLLIDGKEVWKYSGYGVAETTITLQ